MVDKQNPRPLKPEFTKSDHSMTGATQSWRVTLSLLGVIVLVFGFLTVGSSTQQSPTVDESVHLLGGYSYLKWGDYRVNPEHPPLVKMWAALPLLWFGVNDPRGSNPTWNQILKTEPGGPVYPLARETFFKLNDAATLFFYGKIQILIVSMVLALFVYLWSRELFGASAATVALSLYALDPNILAHSTIIHTDLAFAAVVFIGTFVFWRAASGLTWLSLSLTSVLFGLGMITKHSSIVLLLIWSTLGLCKVFSREPQTYAFHSLMGIASKPKQKLLLLVLMITSAVITGYFFIWAAYGFRFSAVPGGMAPLFMTKVSAAHQAVVDPIQSLVLQYRLLPEAFVAGYLYNLKIWRHSAYLLGEISQEGFWSYFPIAFAVKSPLATILMLAAVVGTLRSQKRRLAYLWLAIPVAIYFTLAILSRFNIGVRHLLPIYPFLFVLIGGAIQELWRDGFRIKRTGLIIVGLWYLVSVVSSYPHYLSYFNEIAGGPKNGHKVLLDSNLDWGQDLKGLKPWLDRHGIKQIQLAYFGTAEPRYYGIDDFYSTENLRRWTAAAGGEVTLPEYLAISANFLYGGELFLPVELAQRFNRYKSRRPVASIGDSILVFKLDPKDAQAYEDGAVISARLGAGNMAEALLIKALRLNPVSADAHYQLGALMGQQGKLREAIENYEAVVKLEPRNEKAHFGLANALIRKQRFDDALLHFREAVKIRPNFAEAHYGLGRVLLALGQMVEAIEYFYEALRAKPEFAEVHEDLAQALARQGRTDEAARHYQEALRILRQRRDMGGSGA